MERRMVLPAAWHVLMSSLEGEIKSQICKCNITGLDYLPDLRAAQKRGTVEGSAVVADVGKIDLRYATRTVYHSNESQLENIDVRVLTVVCQILLFKVAAGLIV